MSHPQNDRILEAKLEAEQEKDDAEIDGIDQYNAWRDLETTRERR